MTLINKSIRILTFHSAYSYGAVLQTYALYSFLKKHYTDVKVVDFRPDYFTLKWTWYRPQSWLKYASFQYKKPPIEYTNIVTVDELRHFVPSADTYIIGSDQVWNPNITKSVQDIYFGDFIPKEIKKISYAASFGRTEFSQAEIQQMKSLIHDFNAVSVREESAVGFLHKEFNINAQCVLDPTFLIDDYTNLFHVDNAKDELAFFILNNNSNEVFEIGSSIAKIMKLKPKIINRNKPVKGFKTIMFPSIPKFLKEIYNSRFVITNSYHGLAFSIIFNKQFVYVSTNPQNVTRAQNILEKLHLNNRLFNSYKDIITSHIWEETINYKDVNKTLTNLRQDSIHFLMKNI